MSHSTSNTHLLVYPFPGSSHVIPALDLIHHLLGHGLTITITISSADIQHLEPLISLYPSSLHSFIFSEPEFDPSPHPLIGRVISTQKMFDSIVQWFTSHPSPPVAIVSDILLGWTNELASYLGIQRVVFCPAGALAFNVVHTLWKNIEEINAENAEKDENSLLSFQEIPNSPQFPLWQFPVSLYYKEEEKGYESFRKAMLANLTSWGIVFNSFEGLEGVYTDHIKKQLGHDRVWAVGPLFPDKDDPIPDKLLMWLDKRPDNSVVYICFGTLITLSKKQMSALADALELSNVAFILCTKEKDSRFIPSGFEDRVADRGFIVKGWAPQLAILRHGAVGSFMTHCGWNSTLEGVSAGVMMLTWPIGADQFANAKLLVDVLGVGKRVCEGGLESVPDSVMLARLLDDSQSGDRRERVKMKELSQSASKAVKEGTSARDMDTFVKLLSEISSSN